MSEKKSREAPHSRGSSIKSYAARVFRESSVGMVSSLAETSSKRRKCFKVFVLIFCLTGFLYQSAKFLTVVFQYPTSVDIDIVNPYMFNVPAYTFCDNNVIKRSLFCAKYPERCEEPDEAFCEKYEYYCGDNRTLVPKKQFYSVVKDMSLEEIVPLSGDRNELLLKPNGSNVRHTITGPYLRIDDEYTLLLCYSVDERVNSPEDPVKEQKGTLIRLPIMYFKFHVDDSEMFIPGVRPGILFSIHSPFLAVNPLQTGIFMKPGRNYVIFVSLEEEVLLKKPYETDCINYTEYWLQNGRTGARSQEMCKDNCYHDISMACFNCVVPYLMYPTDKRLCKIEELNEGDCPYDIDNRMYDCEVLCRDDCKRTKYSYNVQERYKTKFDHNGELLDDIDRTIEVKIFLEDDEIIILKHSPKYMIVEVFSTIGGFIGGWLGISLLDVTDIFEGFIRIIRYAFK